MLIPFVGADDSVRPSKCYEFASDFRKNGNFRRVDVGIDPYGMESEIPPHVGADAHIGPLKCFEFASDFRKNGRFRRADRVVRPYGAKSQFHGFAGKPP